MFFKFNPIKKLIITDFNIVVFQKNFKICFYFLIKTKPNHFETFQTFYCFN